MNISKVVKNSQMVTMMNLLYRYPIINSKIIQEETTIPPATINRYLKALTEQKILYADDKKRNTTFYYYDLLNIIRE